MNAILLHELTEQLASECQAIISDYSVRQTMYCKNLPEFVNGCGGCNVAHDVGLYPLSVHPPL